MPSTPRTVLILGANGRFGQAAASAFAHAGWQVLAQVRRTTAQPAGVRCLSTPLDATAALAQQAAGASVVLHAINPPYTAWRKEVLPLARLGMDLAQRLDATFMLPGNVYNYGAQMPALLEETTPQQPSTEKGHIRCELEAEMRKRSVTGLKSVVLRAGDFFGAGSGSWLDLVIVKSIAAGKLVYPGPTDVAHAWAYLPDLARAFVAVAERPGAAAFESLHFAGHTLTGAQLLAAIASAAAPLGLLPNKGFRHGSMPWGLIRAGGLMVPAWRAIAEMSYLWRVPHALSGAALAQRVGVLPSTPLVQALQHSLVALGHGALPAVATASA
jgi:nucleoside-diphosphate-sugar epimerase